MGAGQPLAVSQFGAINYFEQDGLGSVTSLTNAAGGVSGTSIYDAFGNGSQFGAASRFRYTGREYDADDGLYYYRARYYDPVIGRFLAEDPSGWDGGANLYQYAFNDPIFWVDADGRKPRSGGPWHPPAGVDTKCRKGQDSCKNIRNKIWLLQKMITSHEGWDRNVPRPNGGNRHMRPGPNGESPDIVQLYIQLAWCIDLYRKNCNDKDDGSGKKTDCQKAKGGENGVEQMEQLGAGLALGATAGLAPEFLPGEAPTLVPKLIH